MAPWSRVCARLGTAFVPPTSRGDRGSRNPRQGACARQLGLLQALSRACALCRRHAEVAVCCGHVQSCRQRRVAPQQRPCWRVPRLPAPAPKVARTRPRRVRGLKPTESKLLRHRVVWKPSYSSPLRVPTLYQLVWHIKLCRCRSMPRVARVLNRVHGGEKCFPFLQHEPQRGLRVPTIAHATRLIKLAWTPQRTIVDGAEVCAKEA